MVDERQYKLLVIIIVGKQGRVDFLLSLKIISLFYCKKGLSKVAPSNPYWDLYQLSTSLNLVIS